MTLLKMKRKYWRLKAKKETDDKNLNDEARVDDSSPLSDIENDDDESIGSDPLHGDVEHEEHGDVEHEEGGDEPQRKKSELELEKLLIKSETFWKDFNEKKKQGTVTGISSWVQGKDEHQFYTLPVNYMEMQCGEESEGAVFLL